MTELKIPEDVGYIIRKLNDAGFEAYAVGGCVRDTVLGRTPNDWDITTSAMPAQVKVLFRRTIDTGIRHGTVTVLLRDGAYEVTTYRIDGIYEDGRHPVQVTYTSLLSEDLRRRDFTINAMAYHPETGIVDLFGGEADLAAGIVRAVGDPDARFDEDALRVLRAVRFAAQLGFSIDPDTYEAIRRHAEHLRKISKERIREEVTKLLVSDHPDMFSALYETGITAVILPDYDALAGLPQRNAFHCHTVERHTLETLKAIAADPVRRWTMLLHDIGKSRTHTVDPEKETDHYYAHGAVGAEMAREILRDLRFDNETIDAVYTLVRYHDYSFPMTEAGARRAMNKVGEALFPAFLDVMAADTAGKSEYARQILYPAVELVRGQYEKILEEKQCFTLKQLAVKGGDLIRIGVRPGPGMGEVLNRLLDLVIEDPARNIKESLLREAEKILAEMG